MAIEWTAGVYEEVGQLAPPRLHSTWWCICSSVRRISRLRWHQCLRVWCSESSLRRPTASTHWACPKRWCNAPSDFLIGTGNDQAYSYGLIHIVLIQKRSQANRSKHPDNACNKHIDSGGVAVTDVGVVTVTLFVSDDSRSIHHSPNNKRYGKSSQIYAVLKLFFTSYMFITCVTVHTCFFATGNTN